MFESPLLLILFITVAGSLGYLGIRQHKVYLNFRPRKLSQLIAGYQEGFHLASHRGYGKRGTIAENTLEAFKASTAQGFRFHELDVRISKDLVPVLFHGPDLSSTTNGKGKIEAANYADLVDLDWGAYLQSTAANTGNSTAKSALKSKIRKERVAITSLENYLHELGQKCITNIEIKRDFFDFSRGLERNVHVIVKRANCENRVFYSSFNWLTLWRLRKIAPACGRGLLLENYFFYMPLVFILCMILKPDFIHPSHKKLTAEKIKTFKKKGYGVHVWTVNDPKRIEQLKDQGVDIVITDNISLIKNWPEVKKQN